MVWFMVWFMVTWFMVSLMMFFLNMVDYTVFFPVLSTLTLDTLLTLRSTCGFYLNHLIPLKHIKSVFDNVLLEHGGLPHVLPLAVHLFFSLEHVEGGHEVVHHVQVEHYQRHF